MPAKGNVLTGARVRFSLQGVPCAYTMSCNYSEEIVYEELEPIDQYDVAEHVPTHYRVDMSAQLVRLIRNPIKLRDGVSIMPKLEDILNNPEGMTASLEDRHTGTLLANIQSVKLASYRIAISRSITLMDCTFKAIRVRDESEIV